MFRLSEKEFETIRSQIEMLNQDMSSQSVITYPGRCPTSSPPYAFTEQGVVKLSGILNPDKAIMDITIMRAFVEVSKVLLRQADLKGELKEIE